MTDQTFIIDFYVDTYQFKEIKDMYKNQIRYPMVMGPIVLFYTQIVKYDIDEQSGIATVHFIPLGDF